MLVEISVDQRFDQPALNCLVDLINRTYGMQLDYAEIELVSVETFVDPGLTVRDIIEKSTFLTKAQIKVVSTNQIIDIQYVRLLLPAYLYRNIILPNDFSTPAVLKDYFQTTTATVETDAVAYMASEYNVFIDPAEVDIESHPEFRDLDGSWQVKLTPKADHPVWIGPVVLNAHDTPPPTP